VIWNGANDSPVWHRRKTSAPRGLPVNAKSALFCSDCSDVALAASLIYAGQAFADFFMERAGPHPPALF
jgi:hypothetical protein